MDVLTIAWLIAGGLNALALIVYLATRRSTGHPKQTLAGYRTPLVGASR